MTQTELERLKEEIRSEVLEELTKKPSIVNPHWADVKNMIETSYPHPWQSHQMINGISALVRNVYGIKRVGEMTEDQAAAAKEALTVLFTAAAESVK